MADLSNYIDPIFLDRMTYADANGKRRVKNPYRNRKSYDILVPSVNEQGNFVFVVPDGVVGKSILVDFPNGVTYTFTVSAQTDEVTVIGVPVFTYIEVNVVDPRSLPPSDEDLLWDSLGYDAQKSIVAAWGDIELVCNVLYPSTAEAELNFDDQNTIKYGLVGWKNNCGNSRGTDWGRPTVPPNGVYNPPQPIPAPPPTDVGHNYDYKFVLRWQDGSSTDLDFYAYVNHTSNGVSYGEKEYGTDPDKMWLDRDYTTHGSTGYTDEPEIITILGMKSDTVSIQIHNYNGKTLSQDVVVEVLNASQAVIKTYTIPYYHLSGSRNSFWVCDFSPADGTVTDKMKEVSLGTFN